MGSRVKLPTRTHLFLAKRVNLDHTDTTLASPDNHRSTTPENLTYLNAFLKLATIMEKEMPCCSPKAGFLVLRWSILYITAFFVFSDCTEVTFTNLDYIISPYTLQTLKFFSQDLQNPQDGLKNVEIDGKKHILKKQGQIYQLVLQNRSFGSIPENLVQGIEFETLKITQRGEMDPSTMNKVLHVLGTISAKTLHIKDLNIDNSNLDRPNVPQMWFGVMKPSNAQVARCILNITNLCIIFITTNSIVWLQKRVDLSQSRITLVIRGGLDADNLEMVDGFNARRIVGLHLFHLRRVACLDCKLLCGSSLPDELIIVGLNMTTPAILEQLTQNIVNNHWEVLRLPDWMWGEVMKPSKHPKQIRVGNLKIDMPNFTRTSNLQGVPLPKMGNNMAKVESFTLEFYNVKDLIISSDLIYTFEWLSTHFRDMKEFSVGTGFSLANLADFVKHNQFKITTIPSLASIKVSGIECGVYKAESAVVGGVLCFSLDAWEVCMKGKLEQELSQTDLNKLSPNDRDSIGIKTWNGDETEAVCVVCKESFASFKENSSDSSTEIYILDHPSHIVCGVCLGGLIMSNKPILECPVCRREIKNHTIKKRIQRKDHGSFELTIGTDLPILSFPSSDLENLLAHYQE
ncbi:hypothetical protein NEDG_02229 [Nematocida displodere]|uniref:Uncharacterized protein n=1 Tax=Nematocida displodere TaxID=1805483 RepID=A0A177EFD4_9MICR|nr:hypothetical protein NEDG_02229 [Nematocida displodere]